MLTNRLNHARTQFEASRFVMIQILSYNVSRWTRLSQSTTTRKSAPVTGLIVTRDVLVSPEESGPCRVDHKLNFPDFFGLCSPGCRGERKGVEN